MRYRKFKADHLFTGHAWLQEHAVLVTDEAGVIQGIVPEKEAGEDVERYRGILCPGFINCHCHLELSHLQGLIPSGTGMVNFLLAVISQRNFPTEQIQQSIEMAERQMLMQGIVAVGDICNTADTVYQKKLGRIHYHNFVETMGFIGATAPQRFKAAENIYNEFHDGLQPFRYKSRSSIVPHASYSVSKKLLQLIVHFPANDLLTWHNQESIAENDFFRTGKGDLLRLYRSLGIDISPFRASGNSSLQVFLPKLYPGQSAILVHNVVTTEEDLQYMQHVQRSLSQFYFCLCPNANEYIGNGLPDMPLLRRYTDQLVIGTDSLASNRQLSIMEELITLHRHYPDIPLRDLLRWATSNGAAALQMEEELGSFEPGKRPGVLLIENSNAERLTDRAAVKRLL